MSRAASHASGANWADYTDDAALAAAIFAALAEATGDGVGITRECYSAKEDAALAIFCAVARAHDLTIETDAAGNMIVSLPGDDGAAPAHYIGSHADSVPQGGNYDGGAGIVAGLLCLIRLVRDGAAPETPVRLLMLRGEESAFFGRANIGSRALFGLLASKDLEARSRGEGRTLAEAMESVGIDLAPIRNGDVLFDAQKASSYLELHIEQGPVLIDRDLPAGIVSGIRGNLRHRRIVCRGEAGHSGTIPRWLRKDAVFAFADLVERLDEHWRVLLEQGVDLVMTAGIVATDPEESAITRIPGSLTFSFEVRSQSVETLDAFHALFEEVCAEVSQQRGVQFDMDEAVFTEPATMDQALVEKLSRASEASGQKPHVMASGAGHDAAVFANAGIASGMVFVRNASGSHNPQESMEIDDFLSGVDILYNTLA